MSRIFTPLHPLLKDLPRRALFADAQTAKIIVAAGHQPFRRAKGLRPRTLIDAASVPLCARDYPF